MTTKLRTQRTLRLVRFGAAAATVVAGSFVVDTAPAHAAVRGDTITVAGTGVGGTTDGPALSATLKTSRIGYGLGSVFLSDNEIGFRCIRRLDVAAATVSLFAGSCTVPSGFADGPRLSAKFQWTGNSVVTSAGEIYVSDGGNARIRKISAGGVVSTIAGTGVLGYLDGPGATARFREPAGIAVDAQGNVFVADVADNRIRKVTPNGFVTTVAGSGVGGFADGTAATAKFCHPEAVALDALGNLYVSDTWNNRIRKISTTGIVTTVAGTGSTTCTSTTTPPFADGPAATATFASPRGLAFDSAGNLYIADPGNSRIRMLSTTGTVSTLVGSAGFGFADGTAATAKLSNPSSIAMGPAGLYVSDGANYRVRLVTL